MINGANSPFGRDKAREDRLRAQSVLSKAVNRNKAHLGRRTWRAVNCVDVENTYASARTTLHARVFICDSDAENAALAGCRNMSCRDQDMTSHIGREDAPWGLYVVA
jgi:hypothetical protein